MIRLRVTQLQGCWKDWSAKTAARPDLETRGTEGTTETAKAVREWLDRLGVGPLFIGPGSLWENGYCESFNGRLRDELLNREIFYTLQKAKILIETWRREYNEIRPHGSLGHRPPAPQTRTLIPAFALAEGGRLN